MAPPFVDTNILVYSISDDERSLAARAILREPFAISVQILNEFALVLRRKSRFAWAEIESAIADVVEVTRTIRPISLDLHVAALGIAARYDIRFFDAVIVATALRSRSEILYSEDMHHGLVIDDSLTIINPFR